MLTGKDGSAVVLAGSALSAVSGCQIDAPEHWVANRCLADGRMPRRTSLALFVEPAKAHVLQPWPSASAVASFGDVTTYGDFKRRSRNGGVTC